MSLFSTRGYSLKAYSLGYYSERDEPSFTERIDQEVLIGGKEKEPVR
jgi:hypothetical protein